MPSTPTPARNHRLIRTRSLRTHLVALVLLALLPALAVGAVSAWHAIRSYKAAFEESLLETARALALAVDREVEIHRAALATLAASPLLDRAPGGDLAQVYLHAQRAAVAVGATVGLVERSHRILFDTDRPLGTQLPNSAATEATEAAFRSGRPTVSNLLVGAVAGRQIVVVNVPIIRDEAVLALLGTRIKPERFARLLAFQRLSGGAFAVLTDGAGAVITNSIETERSTGSPVPGWYADAASQAQAGIATGRTAAGQEIVLAFQHLASTPGWTAAVAEPLAAYRRSWMQPLFGFAVGGAAVIGLALLGARWLGRLLLRPMTVLTRHAEAVVVESSAPLAPEVPSTVTEFEALRLAIAGADAALRHRTSAEYIATAALRESEEHHRHAVETNPALPWTMTTQGEIDEISQRWLDLTGMPREAMRGGGWSAAIHPDDLSAVTEDWARALSSGEPFDVEHRVRTADGSYRWMRSRASPRYDTDGRVLRWYGTTEDVHERMTAVTALAESERWNREALERLGESLYGLDADYRIVFASRRVLNVWGKSAIEAIGHRLDHIVPQVTIGMVWQVTQRGVERGEEVHLCCLSALSGGWVEGDVYPTDSGGVIIALRDIDDRRRAEIERAKAVSELAEDERYYRALAEVGATSHWRANPAGAVVSSRGGWEALTGQPSAETRGNGWMRMVHPEDLPTIAKIWRTVIAARQTGSAEFRVRTRQGTWCWVRARAVPVSDDRGEMLGWSGIVEDVDARRRAEDALRESEARFARAVEAARVGAWEWDPTTDTMSHSAGHETMLGRPLGSLPNLPEVLKAVHPKDRRIVVETAQRILMRETDRYEAQFRTIWLDGTLRWLRAVGRAEVGSDGTVQRLSGVCMDVTEQVEDQRRRDLLAREVDHRAKNALAVVQSVLRLTPANDAKAFAAAVEGRVAALARVHSLLAEKGWFGADLRVIVERELAPYAEHFDREASIALEGAQVTLAATAVQPFAMVLHELATNAAKYGALSTREGRVEVTWRAGRRFGEDGMLRLCWAERGGPILTSIPARRGFGSRVIETTVRGQLGGSVEQCWATKGLICTIAVPLARVAADRDTSR